MAIKIAVVSQKGGVGKSTLSRLLGVEYARQNWEVKIADMDNKQSTSFAWNTRRLQSNSKPEVSVEQFSSVEKVLKYDSIMDLIIFDGEPHSTVKTLEMAKKSDIVIIPTGTSIDDLDPTIKLCHELKNKGIDRKKIFIVLSRVGSSEPDIESAKDYIQLSTYQLLINRIEEKTAYRTMNDEGKSLTETQYRTLKAKANSIVEEISERINELTN